MKADPASPVPAPDFKLLFESAPGLYLVLAPDLRIVTASDAFLEAVHARRDAMVGKFLLDIFPVHTAEMLGNLRASLEKVRESRQPDRMAVQKYDIRRRPRDGGGIEERYWSIANFPVVRDGRLEFIIHRAEDVTEFVQYGVRPAAEPDLLERARQMAEANQRLRQAREDTDALLRAVTDNIDDVILVKDYEGRYLTINPAGARLLGTPIDRIVGRDDREFFAPEVAAAIRAKDRDILGNGESLSYEESYAVAGRMVTFLTSKSPYRDANGRILGLIGISRDISGLKRAEAEIRELNTSLEQRVAARTAELEAANRDLEAFSYSVSHDLRTPLRSMDGFAKAVLEDYADRLDATGQDYLKRIRDASTRMAGLIDGILELSRIIRQDMNAEAVDLSALAREVAQALQAEAPQRQVDWKIADGMVAEGDRRLLHVVLENLLGNAWKYTSRHARARIEFGTAADPDSTRRVYFVRDDGAGFDMSYAAKLFGPFQRLHGAGEFAGHGVGLATVQRVIHRHRGRIWAEAQVEKGATFFFTLWERGAQD